MEWNVKKYLNMTIAVGALLIGVSAMAQVKPIKEVFEPAAPSPIAKWAKVAVVQWNPGSDTPIDVTKAEAEAFKQSNRKQLEAYVREAVSKGAKMVLTPEFSIVGYPDIPELPSEEDNFQSREQVEPYVERADGASTKYFSKLAKELGIYIHIGFAEVDPKDDKYYNTVVVLGPKGEFVTKYRKIHLFTGEDKFLVPGEDPVTYTTPYGKVGLVICSDIYSGHPMDNYAAQGIDILALSTSWAQYNTGMSNFQNGAKWVKAYVLAANQTYFPDSGVINPDGKTQSHIRQTTGIAYGYVPLKGKGGVK
jgi:predicted amidohydrolase